MWPLEVVPPPGVADPTNFVQRVDHAPARDLRPVRLVKAFDAGILRRLQLIRGAPPPTGRVFAQLPVELATPGWLNPASVNIFPSNNG